MDLKLLKKKNFSLYAGGKFISLIGSNMLQFALSLYVLSITGSAVIFASMLSVLIIPRLLLTPIAGVFGDWFDRKRSIVLLDSVNAVLITCYSMIFFVTGGISIPLLYVFVIVLEITELFFHSAISAILPSIVEKEELMGANAVNSLVNNVGQFLAPVLGSILYGIFGMNVILWISAFGFIVSAVSKMLMNIPRTHKRPEKISLKVFQADLSEGIKVIKGNRFISTIIWLGTIINFSAASLFSIGMLFILKEKLGISDYLYGVFQAVLAFSMIVAPLFAGPITKKYRIGKLNYLSLLITGILIVIMAIAPSPLMQNLPGENMIPFLFILVIAFLIGISITILNIAVGTLFNQIVPLECMGRVSSVMGLAMTVFIPVGQMIFGFLYDTIASEYVIILSGAIIILAVFAYRKTLYRVDEEQEAECSTQANGEERVGDEVPVS